tara:strand:- start:722 stop:1579 length:858 start_codon:yes stop_codon:yes gene_type:complete
MCETIVVSALESLPVLGVGMGYRDPLSNDILQSRDKIDFLEITADHFLQSPTVRWRFLDKLCSQYTLIPHGLNLSLGSAEGLNLEYLNDLIELIKYVKPPWWSEHIAFTKAGEIEIGHLSPLAFNRESIGAFCENVNKVQDKIETPLILENITYNIDLPWNEMEENKFLGEILDRTGCGLLLDVTNLFINAKNHDYDPIQFLETIPAERIIQLHFVGGMIKEGKWIDNHCENTQDDIFILIESVLKYAPVKGIILERDDNFPRFKTLTDELERARNLGRKHQRWD